MLECLEILNLKKSDENEYKLCSSDISPYIFDENAEEHSFFKTTLINPDEIKRPKGDTTFFTTAGVQHIETLQRLDVSLDECSFSVYQPCIRSQYINDTQEGTSTSFVNFASVMLHANKSDFVAQSKSFINLLLSKGASLDSLKFVFNENIPSAWMDKKFNSNNLSVYVNNIEIGECIFVEKLPLSGNTNTSLVEVGFGIERMRWALGKSKYYHSSFENIYENHKNRDSNHISSLIDSIKTSTLIVSSGVLPSPNDHGYRARQLLKKFNNNNKGLLELDELISLSYSYWQSKGAVPKIQEHIVQLIMSREVERQQQVKLQQSTKNKNYDNSEMKELLFRELNNAKRR